MNRTQQLVASLRQKRDSSIIRAQEAEKKAEENKRLLKEKDAQLLKLQQRLEYARSFITLAKQWETAQKKLAESTLKLRAAEEKAARLGPKAEHLEYEVDQLRDKFYETRKREKELVEELASLEI